VTYLHVYDELGVADPAVPTFNVHVFRSFEDSLAYTTCAGNGPPPVTSLLLQSCVAFERVDVGFLGRDQSATPNTTVGPTFVVECLNQNGCSIRLESFNNCTLDQTGAAPLGVTGIVACVLVLCFCAFVGYFFVAHRRFASLEMVVQLSGITLIMLLNLVFWSAFLLTAYFVFPPFYTPVFGGGGVHPSQDSPYARMTDTVFWTDQVMLVLSCLVHLLFVYQFVVAMHGSRAKLVGAVFVCVSVTLIGTIGLPVWFYVETYAPTQNAVHGIVAFYSIMYGVQIIESLLFLIYGLLLLRGHYSEKGFDRTVAKTVILLVLLVLPNIGRMVVAIFSLLSFYYSLLVGDTTGLFFAGFDYYLMRFTTHKSAVMFYVFAFLIPDVIPCVVLLALLFDSVYQQVLGSGGWKKDKEQPLLESSRSPAAYEL
jgi:hypothetical protein